MRPLPLLLGSGAVLGLERGTPFGTMGKGLPHSADLLSCATERDKKFKFHR